MTQNLRSIIRLSNTPMRELNNLYQFFCYSDASGPLRSRPAAERRNLILCPSVKLAFLALLWILLMNPRSLGQKYEAEGYLNVTFPADAPHEKRTLPFSVAVMGCDEWLVKIIPQATEAGYLEVGCERGTNIYKVWGFGNNQRSPAEIIGGEVPVFRDGLEATVVWLAFNSSCVLQEIETKDFPVFYKPGLLGDRRKVIPRFPATWQLVGNGPQALLQTFAMMEPGKYTATLALGGSLPQVINHSPPYHEGFKSCAFKIGETANTLGRDFPMRFLFEVFRPARKGKDRDDLIVQQRFEGIVTNITETLDRFSYQPRIPVGGVRARDWRFVDKVEGPISYESRSWLDKQGVQELPEYSNAVQKRPAIPQLGLATPRNSLSTVILLALLLLLVPVLLLYLKNKKRED